MLTIKDFCAFTKISIRHFHTMKAQGIGPTITRIGRRVLVSPDSAREWLASQERLAA